MERTEINWFVTTRRFIQNYIYHYSVSEFRRNPIQFSPATFLRCSRKYISKKREVTLNFKEHNLALENKLDFEGTALGDLPTVHTRVGFGSVSQLTNTRASSLQWRNQGFTCWFYSLFTSRCWCWQVAWSREQGGKGKMGGVLHALNSASLPLLHQPAVQGNPRALQTQLHGRGCPWS